MSDQQNPHSFWVAPRAADMRVFHHDKDCGRLKREPRKKPHTFIEWHELEPCSWCDPDRESPYE